MTFRKRAQAHDDLLEIAGLSGSFSEELRVELAQHSDILRVPAGAVLARAGRMPRQLIAVVDGCVDIDDEAGGTRVAGPGSRIGAMELVEERPHTSTVTTRTPATLVVVFGPAFRWATRAMAGSRGGTATQASPLVSVPELDPPIPPRRPALAR